MTMALEAGGDPQGVVVSTAFHELFFSKFLAPSHIDKDQTVRCVCGCVKGKGRRSGEHGRKDREMRKWKKTHAQIYIPGCAHVRLRVNVYI